MAMVAGARSNHFVYQLAEISRQSLAFHPARTVASRLVVKLTASLQDADSSIAKARLRGPKEHAAVADAASHGRDCLASECGLIAKIAPWRVEIVLLPVFADRKKCQHGFLLFLDSRWITFDGIEILMRMIRTNTIGRMPT